MTREEFRGALSDIDEGGRLSYSEEARKAEILLLDHDKEQRAEVARLREALKNIFALVIGECPSLLNEDSGGDAVLCLEIENILKETP